MRARPRSRRSVRAAHLAARLPRVRLCAAIGAICAVWRLAVRPPARTSQTVRTRHARLSRGPPLGPFGPPRPGRSPNRAARASIPGWPAIWTRHAAARARSGFGCRFALEFGPRVRCGYGGFVEKMHGRPASFWWRHACRKFRHDPGRRRRCAVGDSRAARRHNAHPHLNALTNGHRRHEIGMPNDSSGTHHRNRPASCAFDDANVHAFVDNVIVDDGVVGNVPRAVNDIYNLHRIPDRNSAIVRVLDLSQTDKYPVPREEVFIVSRPVPARIAIQTGGLARAKAERESQTADADIATSAEKCIIGRRRHPANILIVAAPCDPARTPDIAGNPQPPIVGIIYPASIVEWNVAPGEIRFMPVPAILIRIDPAPRRVIRMEIIRHIARLPYETPAVAVEPVSERREVDPKNNPG